MEGVGNADENNCDATAPISLSQPDTLYFIEIDTGHVSCNGGDDGFINVTVGGVVSTTFTVLIAWLAAFSAASNTLYVTI